MKKIIIALIILFFTAFSAGCMESLITRNCDTSLYWDEMDALVDTVPKIAISISTSSNGKDCSSVLVAPSVLLTAGHCLKNATEIKVYNTDIFGINWYSHKNIDMGLIILNKPIENINPIEINTTFETCNDLYVIGYGGGDIINSAFYVKSDKDYIRFRPMPVHGDSGGALVSCHNGNCELVGIVSKMIYRPFGVGDRGLAANLNEHLNWIEDKLNYKLE